MTKSQFARQVERDLRDARIELTQMESELEHLRRDNHKNVNRADINDLLVTIEEQNDYISDLQNDLANIDHVYEVGLHDYNTRLKQEELLHDYEG